MKPKGDVTMSKICENCKNPLKDNAKFCPKCGMPVNDAPKESILKNTSDTGIIMAESDNKKSKSKKILFTILKIAAGIVVLFFVAVLASVLMGDKDTKTKVNDSSASQQQSKTANSVESVLANFGIKGKIGNSTFGNNKDGFMASVDNKIYVVDLKNNQVARVENYSFILNDLLKKRGRISESTLIPQFLIYNDKHDKDADKGEWRGDNHFLPVYILIQFDAAGNVKSKGKMSSGKGAAPSHYQGFLEEQKNIDLANIFLRDISSFMDSSDASVAPNPSPVYYGIINANDVNVRKGPGKNYKSLGVFFKGDKLRLVNEASDAEGGSINWYQIEFDNPQVGLIKGWVRKDFINLAK